MKKNKGSKKGKSNKTKGSSEPLIGQIKCPSCRKLIQEGLTFCPECGDRIPEFLRYNPIS
jgi:rRNA maturation endonuclease Nob1